MFSAALPRSPTCQLCHVVRVVNQTPPHSLAIAMWDAQYKETSSKYKSIIGGKNGNIGTTFNLNLFPQFES